jgi:hypothetical protein
MKKTVFLTALALLAGGLLSAANPASDFLYDLNKAGDGVVITGYSGKAAAVDIPGTIEDFPVVEIGDRAFAKAKINSVIIPDSVTRLGAYCFSFADAQKDDVTPNPTLRTVRFPKNLKEIGEGAFAVCTTLSAVTLPAALTSLGTYAFFGCAALTTLTLPDTVTTIGEGAFLYCKALKAVTLKAGITSIGARAFASCEGLTTVSIPDSVTSIGNNAFSNCTALTTLTIPNGVVSIEYATFYGCTGLTTVNIPDSVTSVKRGAFYGCTALTTVNMNTHPIEFEGGDGAVFGGCTRLSLAARKKLQDSGYTQGYERSAKWDSL